MESAQIAEAASTCPRSQFRRSGALRAQAAIAAEHCRAARADDTDWRQILRYYDLLEDIHSSPVISLNRAVAVAMVDGIAPALELIDTLAESGELEGYHLLHAARADLLRARDRRPKRHCGMNGLWRW